MKTGMIGEAKTVVTENNTALAAGSGSEMVFATPMLVALMEKAAVAALGNTVAPGQTTVGTKIDVTHTAATPIGGEVTASAVLVEIEGRRLIFSVSAKDTAGPVGQGTHERYLVETQKFLAKAAARL